MLRDCDGFRERQTLHLLLPEWRRKIPRARRRGIATLQLAIREEEASAWITLACRPSSARGLPAIERNKDEDFVRCGPVAHGRRGQKVSQSAVEPHRRNNCDAGVSRGVRKLLEAT